MPSKWVYEPLLDFIAKAEGTAAPRGREYDTTLSYGKFTGGPIKLTDKTLDQIDAIQIGMLNNRNNYMNSSAAGRYQIVRKTLLRIKRALKWHGRRLYDADTQDAAARYLLWVRGIDKYLEGRMREDRLITELSKEWASFPDLDGYSYYDRSHRQRASVTIKEVREVLRRVRQRAEVGTSTEPTPNEPRDRTSFFGWLWTLILEALT